jgi:hypothetical protein
MISNTMVTRIRNNTSESIRTELFVKNTNKNTFYLLKINKRMLGKTGWEITKLHNYIWRELT